MPITEREIEIVRGIVLDGAKAHFPSSVEFQGANVTVRLDAEEEEFLDIQLLYSAPEPVLDGHLMNTLFRVIDEPIRASGTTARALIRYTDINDAASLASHKPFAPPAPDR